MIYKSILKAKVSFSRKIALILAQREIDAARRRREQYRQKPRNRHRNRGYALDEMEHLDVETFLCMFRVDRDTFNELEERIAPLVHRDEVKAVNSSGQAITARTKLAVTLRWLAGGSYIDICFAWGISKSSFFNADRGVLWPTIDALDAVLPKIGLSLNNMDQLQRYLYCYDIRFKFLTSCTVAYPMVSQLIPAES